MNVPKNIKRNKKSKNAASEQLIPVSQLSKLMARSAVDETARRFIATVANPFDAKPSRGISNATTYISTACIRRRNVCTVGLAPGVSGCDIFIPQGTSADPYVYVATNAAAGWTGATTVTTFNYDSTVTVPVGSNGRIVASGVRIMCLESSTNTGGVFYHYWMPSGTDGGTGNSSIAPTFGAAKSGATEAISIAPVRPGATTTFINPSAASWDVIDDASVVHTAVTTGTPTGWPTGVHGTRLFYDGSSGATALKFIIEVVSIVEYYHDAHKNFTEPSVTHSNGEAITNAVNASLTVRASNNSHVESHGGHSSLTSKLHAVAGALEAGGRVMMTGLKYLYGGIQGYKC